MDIHWSTDPVHFPHLTSAELRAAFLVDALFRPDQIDLLYGELDRVVVGSAVPATAPLTLPAPPALRAEFFCQRRELGILNIGGPGTVTVDDQLFALANRDLLYVGRGNRQISFAGAPATFYLLSYPAHATYPTRLIRQAEATATPLGSTTEANLRTIYKYIHPAGGPSCQLVMGLTQLAPGSVWNTMPPHTHARRSEVYLYFDLTESARVVHLLGPPTETRHLLVANRQAVLSPSWSIHAAAGTGAYAFCWGMGGENQDFADMDPVRLEDLR